jgi:transposase
MNIYINIIEELSLKNKYFYIWLSIIVNARKRACNKIEAKNKIGYVEGHHIVPKSFDLGGDIDLENIVYLSAKEHILVHRLMCKFTQNEYRIKSLRAFHCMVFIDNGGKNNRKTSLYQRAKAREAISLANKGKRGIKGVPNWFFVSKNIVEFEQTLRKHVFDGLSDSEIANKYDVSSTAIHNWRNKLDIKKRRWQLRDKKWLYNNYIDKKLSCQDIANIIGCTSSIVQIRLREFEIPIRDSYARQKNVNKEKRGFFPAKDLNGNKYFIKNDDPRYLSGELVGFNKNIKINSLNGYS